MAGPAAERRAFAACGLLALAVFALVAWQVASGGELTEVDRAVLRWVVAHRSEGVTRFMRAISLVHMNVPVLVAIALLALWLRARRARSLAVFVTLLVPLGMLLNRGMKELFQRARPVPEDALVHIATYSFPSAHAAAATLFYAAVCSVVFARTRSRLARTIAVVAGAVMVATVAASRVYLGVHYVSDTVGAFLLASAWVCALRWAQNR